MNALDADADDANNSRADGHNEGGGSIADIMVKYSLIKREDSDPENSAFAGRLAILLKSMAKE